MKLGSGGGGISSHSSIQEAEAAGFEAKLIYREGVPGEPEGEKKRSKENQSSDFSVAGGLSLSIFLPMVETVYEQWFVVALFTILRLKNKPDLVTCVYSPS